MDIKIAREVAARIWCDQEVSAIEMDVELAEEIAQLLASRLTKRAADLRQHCGHHAKYLFRLGNGKLICRYCGASR